MGLDRDELAARCYLAIITPLDGCAPVEDWDYEVLSDTATKAADALLSRLAPAPSPSLADGEWRDAPKPAAPSPAASPAPMWVRFDPPVRLDAPDGGIVKGHVSVLPPPVAPTVEAALAALDVEPRHDAARMVTTYDILGLDDVRAAHRAEVDAAVKAEREACARAVEKAYIDRPAYNGGDSPEWVASNESRRVAAAIRARGEAQS